MLHALLIDDEASARADLRGKLATHPGVTVVGEAATILAARALLASAEYDLVFLDVQLIGGEAFQLVPLVHPGASIVFATAHESYALRAFESRAVDYLLKPIAPARLAEALLRVAAARATRVAHDPPVAPAAPVRPSVPIPPVARMAPPARPGVPAFPANSCEVALADDERIYLRQCLEAWEDSLPPTHVLRAAHASTARFPRAVRYERDTDATRVFLAGSPVSVALRWWRSLRVLLRRMIGLFPAFLNIIPPIRPNASRRRAAADQFNHGLHG